MDTAHRLTDELKRVESTDPRSIVVDLSGLEFIDSVGISVLIAVSARSRVHGHDLTIVRGSDNVHRPFELCGLASRLPFVDQAQA